MEDTETSILKGFAFLKFNCTNSLISQIYLHIKIKQEK